MYEKNNQYIKKAEETDDQEYSIPFWSPLKRLRLIYEDGQLTNDDTDTETVTLEVVDGLEIARGADPAEATVLDYDGTATVEIGGAEHSVSINGGTGTLDYATTQPAPATVDMQATALADVPAEVSNLRTIKLIQA